MGIPLLFRRVDRSCPAFRVSLAEIFGLLFQGRLAGLALQQVILHSLSAFLLSIIFPPLGLFDAEEPSNRVASPPAAPILDVDTPRRKPGEPIQILSKLCRPPPTSVPIRRRWRGLMDAACELCRSETRKP